MCGIRDLWNMRKPNKGHSSWISESYRDELVVKWSLKKRKFIQCFNLLSHGTRLYRCLPCFGAHLAGNLPKSSLRSRRACPLPAFWRFKKTQSLCSKCKCSGQTIATSTGPDPQRVAEEGKSPYLRDIQVGDIILTSAEILPTKIPQTNHVFVNKINF